MSFRRYFRLARLSLVGGMAGWVASSALHALNPDTPAGSYAIQGWFAEDGLPASRVRSVLQTQDGYIWLATAAGIARFDGLRFSSWTTDNEPAFKTNNFYHIEESRDGTLWFASANGLYRYAAGQITRYDTTQGLTSTYVRMIYELRDGRLLIGTDHGVSVMVSERAATPEVWKQATGAIRAFLEAKAGPIWVAGRDGLWRLVDGRMEKLSGTSIWPAATYTAFAEEPDGRVWVGSNRDLRCWHPDGTVDVFATAQGLTSQSIESLHIDRDGSLWIGTAGGLFRLREGHIEHAPYPTHIGSSLIGEMGETREGALWVGSNAGVFQLRETAAHAVGYVDGLEQAVVLTMLDANDGAWWIGLWSGGVYRYEHGRAVPVPEFASIHGSVFYALWQDPDGTMWVGGDAGLFRQRDGGWKNCYLGTAAAEWQKRLAAQPGLELPGLIHNRVNSIAPDGASGHWVATLGGLYHAITEDRFQLVAETLGTNVRAVYRARDGDIWVSAQGRGLLRLHEGKWRSYGVADGLANSTPRAIYQDSTGVIWVCSTAGVSRFSAEKWRHYGSAEGLSDQINSVVEDSLGYLWFGTPKGVLRVARADFAELEVGRRKRVSEQTMTRRDGMPDSECIELGSPNAWATRTGLLLFPTNGGLAVFDPRAVKPNAVPPPVHIEGVVAGGVRQPNLGRLAFPPGTRDLEIQFSGASFLEPERVRFKVRLTPLDTQWVDVGNRHDVRYPRLPPGQYDFQVIACNNDDRWNEEGAHLPFTVKPFFYQTAWFALLGTVAFAGGAVGAYRWRVRRLRSRAAELQAQNQELERRVAERTAELAKSYESLRRAQQDLIDASRLAGMAEVATGVLHQVGNALNSVNTSASMVATGIDRLHAPNLGKVAQLLAEHSGRLPEFFASDPRAQKLPEYLARLAEHLEAEHAATLREMNDLVVNVEHIKEIVVAQQAFARAPGVIEVIAPTQLVELAVGVVEASLKTNGITLTKEFAAVPPVAVERPKMVEVLVSLLRNAQESVLEANGPERLITVLVQPADLDQVEISVTDSGVGIAPGNLTRIFAVGFTTKQAGRGFGLHNSALVAKELGGSLAAQSKGLGHGATFVLRLPLAHDAAGNASVGRA